MSESTKCSKCGGPRDRVGQAYCRRCHAEYNRNWRAVQRLKAVALKERATREGWGGAVETPRWEGVLRKPGFLGI